MSKMRFEHGILAELFPSSCRSITVRTWIAAALLFLLATLTQQGCESGHRTDRGGPSLTSATDALGREVSLEEYPRRIVSTAPSNTEILLALGLGEKLVGVTSFYGYPEKVEGIAKIGGYTNPSVEKIVSLRPNLVFAARGNPRDVIEQLRRHGIKVFTLDTRTVSGLLADIQKVGKLTGAREEARRCVADIEGEIRNVRQEVGNLPAGQKPRVLWVGQEQPLRSAGPGSLIDELIRLAGGKNVTGKEKSRWPSYSMEKLVLQDPQVIILGEDKYKDSPARVAETLARFRRDGVWRSISAIKTGRVYYIPTDLLGQPSPGFLEGLKALAGHLHPDLFTERLGGKHRAKTEKDSD